MADSEDSTLVVSSPAKRKADEIDSPEEQAPTKVIEVVPNADITFKVGVGKDALDIKASGMVMSLTSPVFARMLSGPFIEAESRIISLPEDDPEVFLQFCNIVHHQPTKLDRLTGRQVLDLAMLVDMRQSQDVVLPWLFLRAAEVRCVLARKKGFFSSIFIGAPTSLSLVGEKEKRFSAGDMIDLGAICALRMTFWRATRHCVSHYPSDSKQPFEERESIPSIVNVNGEHGYDAIAKGYGQYVKALLKEVFACINEDIDLLRCGASSQSIPIKPRSMGCSIFS